MIKILKLAFAVILATVVGMWASEYHGYIILILGDTSIKVSLVGCVFLVFIAMFVMLFGYRFVRLILSAPITVYDWFVGLFVTNKKDKFVDIVAAISLGQEDKIIKMNSSKMLKATPVFLKKYIMFNRLNALANKQHLDDLVEELKLVEHKKNGKANTIYKFFNIYRLYLLEEYSEAKLGIQKLTDEKNKRLMPNIINLAALIAQADDDSDLAFSILEKHYVYLNDSNGERLIELALKGARSLKQLKLIYNKTEATPSLNRVYLEQLIKFNDMSNAQKFVKKQLNDSNIDSGILCIYVNAFTVEVAKLFPKVCDKSSTNYDSMITLLELAMMKSDNYLFKMIYNYIESNVSRFLSPLENEKYNHVLCRFYIKNGKLSGVDLSETRLVYQTNEVD